MDTQQAARLKESATFMGNFNTKSDLELRKRKKHIETRLKECMASL